MDLSEKKIGIIAIGYNRHGSLKRLLYFLEKANYSVSSVPLIISLDYCDDYKIKEYANEFQWIHGEKTVCFSNSRLGLRNHVLKCGNYINEYELDAAVVFEDDIVPAWDYYTYVRQAVECFGDDEQIAGIALYSHKKNPNGREPFQPAYSQYDNYFMQYACSWGQVWTKKQWNCFYEWYLEHKEELFCQITVPSNVCGWPESSWLKYYIKYCVERRKYFVYPYVALATNFNEAGTHVKETENSFQIPILEGKKENYFFGNLDEAIKYDAFFERIGLGKTLGVREEELCIDLYGKQPKHRNCRYWLTSGKADYHIQKQYGNSLKVKEQNVIYEIGGNEIFLYDTLEKRDNHWNDMKQLVKESNITAERKGLVLAGAGANGKWWLERLEAENIEVLCFADMDENKIGRELYGKKIISYHEMKKIQDKINIFITILNTKVKKELETMLMEMGFEAQIIGSPCSDCQISENSSVYNSYLEGKNLMLDGAELINSWLGRCSYLSEHAKLKNTKVGRYSCIGPDVQIIMGQHPTSDFVSIHPAFYSTKNEIGYSYVEKNKFDEIRRARGGYSVIIGNDVWIGMGARIMEGVTIADGSVIAAGAVVVNNTKPFEVVGGVPAKHIKYRFNEEERDCLSELEWWNKDLKWITEHAEKFENIKLFLSDV